MKPTSLFRYYDTSWRSFLKENNEMQIRAQHSKQFFLSTTRSSAEKRGIKMITSLNLERALFHRPSALKFPVILSFKKIFKSCYHLQTAACSRVITLLTEIWQPDKVRWTCDSWTMITVLSSIYRLYPQFILKFKMLNKIYS